MGAAVVGVAEGDEGGPGDGGAVAGGVVVGAVVVEVPVVGEGVGVGVGGAGAVEGEVVAFGDGVGPPASTVGGVLTTSTITAGAISKELGPFRPSADVERVRTSEPAMSYTRITSRLCELTYNSPSVPKVRP